MGKSLSVLRITDDQIQDFRKKPKRLEELLKSTIPYSSDDCC